MEDNGLKIALYGAAGAMGRQILLALEGEGLPIDRLVVVGESNSVGTSVSWRNSPQTVVRCEEVPIGDLDIAILAIPAMAAAPLRAILVAQGVLVLDLSRGGGDAEGIPIVWPSLGLDATETHEGMLTVPCGNVGAIAVIVSCLSKLGEITRIHCTVLMGAASAGRDGEQCLSDQTVELLSSRMPNTGVLGAHLAFNVIPGSHQVDTLAQDPFESETAREVQRLVPGLAAIPMHITPLRVSAFAGTGIALTLQYEGEAPALSELGQAVERQEELELTPHGPALRDALDGEKILVGHPRRDQDDTLRCFLSLDPLSLSAAAVGHLVSHIHHQDLW